MQKRPKYSVQVYRSKIRVRYHELILLVEDMVHHHAIFTDIQYKVNYAIYTFQDCGYIILLFVGGAVVGGTFLRPSSL